MKKMCNRFEIALNTYKHFFLNQIVNFKAHELFEFQNHRSQETKTLFKKYNFQ